MTAMPGAMISTAECFSCCDYNEQMLGVRLDGCKTKEIEGTVLSPRGPDAGKATPKLTHNN